MTKGKSGKVAQIVLAIISIVVLGLGGAAVAFGRWIGSAETQHKTFARDISENKVVSRKALNNTQWIKGALQARGFKPNE